MKYNIKFPIPQINAIRLTTLGFLLIILINSECYAYIGPGAGFAVMGSFFAVFMAFLSALATIFFWPIRYVLRSIRRKRAFSHSKIKKFVIIGLDGLDPVLTEKFMADSKLPNLSRLANKGCFKPLQSTTPPISPVAWSTFQTGVNPGKHNIFDFLTRDPKTYLPTLSSVSIRPPSRALTIGKFRLPLRRPDIRLLRKGKPFWTTLGEHGIFSNIIRVPITFPPEKFHGIQLSAMCVPDLRGTQGSFSFFTSKSIHEEGRTGGDTFHVQQTGDTVNGELIGPENPFLKNSEILTAGFSVCDITEESAVLKVNGDTHSLQKNHYTEWIKVNFKAAPGIKISGICKFLLIRTRPFFEMYVSPVQIDPDKPALQISHPAVYATYFSKRMGPYATLGLAEDTWALNEHILEDDTFLDQAIDIEKEREAMFFDTLEKVKHGFCICVFDGTDRIQHSFWRHIDPGHPANRIYETPPASPDAIESVYRRMDDLVGKTMDRCDDDTILMVISDHGFNSFRYGVDLNCWLAENGYLHLIPEKREQKHLLAVDWFRTKAFAIGLAGIFLNIKGREKSGIVDPGKEASLLRQEIAGKLSALLHPDTGDRAVETVYNSLELYSGPYKSNAPDLIVGYRPGFRASWDTAIGLVTDRVFHDNTKAWSGDHCIDPSFVPGVLFCSHPVSENTPRLMDIGPTVLDMFGIKTPKNMDGIPLTIKLASKNNT